MAVTVDVATEDVRTATTSPQTFSHVGASSGIKGVVLVLIHNVSSTDHVSAASYGGVAMTRIQRNTDGSAEPGAAELWFLGSSVPQGTQTVSYTPGATDDDFHAIILTLLGSDDLEVVDFDGVSNAVANPQVTLQYSGRTCMAFAACYSATNTPANMAAVLSGCSTVHDHDFTAQSSAVIRQTTAGSTDFAIGYTIASTGQALAAMAISEIAAGLTPPSSRLMLLSIG